MRTPPSSCQYVPVRVWRSKSLFALQPGCHLPGQESTWQLPDGCLLTFLRNLQAQAQAQAQAAIPGAQKQRLSQAATLVSIQTWACQSPGSVQAREKTTRTLSKQPLRPCLVCCLRRTCLAGEQPDSCLGFACLEAGQPGVQNKGLFGWCLGFHAWKKVVPEGSLKSR